MNSRTKNVSQCLVNLSRIYLRARHEETWAKFFTMATPRDFENLDDLLWSLANRRDCFPTNEELCALAHYFFENRE